MLLLRWVLIIATAYLMLFNRSEATIPLDMALFVSAYFGSNVLLGILLRRTTATRSLRIGVVLFDVGAVAAALVLTDNVGADFFVLYFLVLFLAALTERLGLVVGAALLASVMHLTTTARFADATQLMTSGYALRVPFLLTVALFFGYLVEQDTRSRKRSRADFVSGISHDIKNPLGVVQSLAEILLDAKTGALNPQQVDLVHRIHANVRRALMLALNLVDAARIEAGRMVLQRRPQELSDVLAEALSVASSAARLNGLTLECKMDPQVTPADIDFSQMERAISNLLDNAIKYTPEGGTVSASLSSSATEVVLSVRDTGPGISPSDLPGLFEAYRRRSGSTRAAGTGLGLFIAKSIVAAHGGHLTVDSAAGTGTTMTIRLPASRPVPEKAPAGHPERAVSPRKAWGLLSR